MLNISVIDNVATTVSNSELFFPHLSVSVETLLLPQAKQLLLDLIGNLLSHHHCQ